MVTTDDPSETGSPDPDISVILPADSPRSIRDVISHLAAQTIRGRIEIVIATDPTGRPEFECLAESSDEFFAIRIATLPSLESLGEARARAVKAARAPCVFLGETHSFARATDFAEKLVERHAQGWSVVVPGFENANPGRSVSWSGFLLDYGHWLAEREGGELDYWPLNNACVDRGALLSYPGDLSEALSYGDELLAALRRAGHKVWLEPAATLAHMNIARWRPWIDEHWVAGCLVAAYRSRRWSLARRVLYAGAAPAIALLLYARVFRPARAAVRRHDLPATVLLIMAIGVVVRAAGEALGYTHLVSGKSFERRMTEYELHKPRYT